MEPITIWFNFWIAVAVLALNLRVRAAAMLQDQSALERRVFQAACGSFGGAGLCVLFAIVYFCVGLPAWSWISMAIVLTVSVAVPLLIQVRTGGVGWGRLKRVGQKDGHCCPSADMCGSSRYFC
ncbi:MAG: hypothetical protein FJ005_09125 [Chloroflexi bacterium]|nr:hypothetical protein [Chloroflexota bacterium]